MIFITCSCTSMLVGLRMNIIVLLHTHRLWTLNSEVMYLWDKLCPLLVKPVKSSAQNKVLALWTSNSVSWPEFKIINQFISLCFPFADRKTLYHRTAWVNVTFTFKYSSEISYSKIFTNTDLYGCYFSCILYLTKWSTRDGISLKASVSKSAGTCHTNTTVPC